MRNVVLLLAVIFCVSVVCAQNDDDNISVYSFKKLESDLAARTKPVKDQNGDPCALIKVVVPGDGFVFEGDMLGIVTTEHKVGEYWVYVPHGAKYLNIKSNKVGVLRYRYPEKIDKLCTYEMKLALKKASIDGNYLIINVFPKNATIYIDENKLDAEIRSPFLNVGMHNYRIVCDNYVTKEGRVNIDKSAKTKLDIRLERSYGYADIRFKPDGAKVFVNEKNVGITPVKIKLEAGTHKIKITSDKYLDEIQTVTITHNCNLQVDGELKKSPTGKISVKSNPKGASVYIDEKYSGTTNGTYEMPIGGHVVRLQKSGYNDVTATVVVKSGETRYVSENMSRTKSQKRDDRLSKRYINSGTRGFVEFGFNYAVNANDFKKGVLEEDDVNEEDVSYSEMIGSGGQFAFSVGRNIKPFWYSGLGWGFIYTYTGSSKFCWSSPIYIENRIEFFNRRVSPFVGLKLGAGLVAETNNSNNSDGYEWSENDSYYYDYDYSDPQYYNAYQFYMSQSVGVRFSRFSLALSLTNDMTVRNCSFRTPRFLSLSFVYDWGARH